MEEIVLQIIKKYNEKGIDANAICDRLKQKDADELRKTLNDLETKGIIYKTEKGKYTLLPSNYIISELNCSSKGNHYIVYNGMKYHVNYDDLNAALDFDTVIAEVDFETKSAVIKKVLSRKNNKIVCEVKNDGKRKKLESFNTPGEISIIISQNELDKLVEGDRVIVEIDKDSFLNCTKGSVIEVIGHKNDPDIDEISIANSRGFSTIFSDKYLKEVSEIPISINEDEIKGRIDLRNEQIFTIDCNTTKDFDDAISLKLLDNGNYELGVHIANVSHYIKYGSEIYNEAYERGTSLYLFDSVIPMLHKLLSNGICSLNPGVDRLTKSCIMQINQAGEVVSYKICDSIICSKMRMTYDDVNMILEGKEVPKEYDAFKNTLFNMYELSKILSNKSENLGYIEFASNEIKVIKDNDSNKLEFKKVKNGKAEKIIENFMIVANETVASHIYWQNLPFIYRVHGMPDDFKLEKTIDLIKILGYRLNSLKDIDSPKLLQSILNELSNMEEFDVLSSLFLRSMEKAKYSSYNIGHFALAKDYYTHFTSPIRRFPDLLVHILLDAYNDSQKIDYEQLELYLKKACEHSSYKERQSDLAEEEMNRLKMVDYMKDYIGQSFVARIVDIYPDEISIITENNIRGIIPSSYIVSEGLNYNSYNRSMSNSNSLYLLGNKIEVKVSSVDRDKKKIYFSLEKNLSLDEKAKSKILKNNKRHKK